MAVAVLTTPNQPELYANILQTFPKYQTLTGTVTSNGNIIYGQGTLFLTEIANAVGINYGYLVDLANFEIRRITDINSETSLVVRMPFTNNLGFQTVKWIPHYRFMDITALEQSNQTWKFNNVLLGAGEPKSFTKEFFDEKDLSPFFVDTTTNGNKVDISWQS
jgi:L-cystine uptake protein TcyP (sodium:dicarboxylate symporter family)